jgi:penicillin amidase
MSEDLLGDLSLEIQAKLADAPAEKLLLAIKREGLDSLISSKLNDKTIELKTLNTDLSESDLNSESDSGSSSKNKFVENSLFSRSDLSLQAFQIDDRRIVRNFPGILDTLEIQREPSGVVHIQAENNQDLFFGLGMVHAHDRLWQMDYQRRIAAGSLAEILGQDAVSSDVFLRTLGLYRSAESAYENLSPETKEIVDSYTAGINAYLDLDRELPSEFQILGYEPESWSPVDVLATSKLLSLSSSRNFQTELFRVQLLSHGLSFDRILEIFPSYQGDVTTLKPEDIAKIPGLSSTSPLASEELPSFENVDIPDESLKMLEDLEQSLSVFSSASNVWAVSGDRTTTGKPFLANDPHRDLTIPSGWYLVDLQSPEFSAIGASFPGLPGIGVGHNDRISWGITNSQADVQDLYVPIETPDKTGYIYNGQFQPYEVRQETIQVKGGGEIVIPVRETVYGPVISDALGIPQPLSLKWVSLSETDGTIETLVKVNQSQNWQDFTEALESYTTPAQNFVYADVDGNIGYFMPGLLPIRQPGHTGLVPVPGTGQFDWQGFVPFDQLPQVLNPESGFIVSGNNRIAPSEYPYYISSEWAEPYRAERITKLITEKDELSLKDMRAIQLDQVSLLYRDFRPILESLKPILEGLDPLPKKAIARLNSLLDWDGKITVNSRKATIFESWYSKLLEIPASIVGDAILFLEPMPRFLLKVLQEGDPACGDAETCLAKAAELFVEVTDSFGSNVPRWGEIHQATFEHPVLPISEQVPYGGDRYTVNVGLYDPNTFEMDFGAGYRQIIDLSNLEKSVYITAPGQSEQTDSAYFDNLLGLWQDGKYLPMLTEDFPVARQITLEDSEEFDNLVLSEGINAGDNPNLSADNSIIPFLNQDTESVAI